MDLNSLANLGEFIAGLGVVISVAYLAVQVRQNTAQVRASTTQDYSDAVGHLLESVYSSPEVMEFFVHAIREPERMTEPEWLRWHLLVTRVMRHFDAAFYQYRTGTMDEEIWTGIRFSIIGWVEQPGFVAWFQRYGDRISPAFNALLVEAVPALSADAI